MVVRRMFCALSQQSLLVSFVRVGGSVGASVRYMPPTPAYRSLSGTCLPHPRTGFCQVRASHRLPHLRMRYLNPSTSPTLCSSVRGCTRACRATSRASSTHTRFHLHVASSRLAAALRVGRRGRQVSLRACGHGALLDDFFESITAHEHLLIVLATARQCTGAFWAGAAARAYSSAVWPTRQRSSAHLHMTKLTCGKARRRRLKATTQRGVQNQ